jgi:hypothetical protein
LLPRKRLVRLDLISAGPLILIQTEWRGRNGSETQTESFRDQGRLMERVLELAPLIFPAPPAAARSAEGIAATAANPEPAPAAGDLAAAA